MYLMFLIFILLSFRRVQRGLHENALISVVAFVAIFYILNLLGIGFFYNPLLDLAGFAGAVFVLVWRFRGRIVRRFKTTWPLLALFSAAFVALTIVFSQTVVLPSYDPIAVPAYAKLIFSNAHIPDTTKPLSDGVFSYPPGFSILFSVFFVFRDNPLFLLQSYKLLNIGVMVLTPLLWAIYFPKLFNIRINRVLAFVAFSAAFYLFDRSIDYAVIYAGKNAMLLCASLFPFVLYRFFARSRPILDLVINALLLLALLLIHYTFLYMFVIAAVFVFLFRFKTYSKNILFYVAGFAVAIALFLPYLLRVAFGPSALASSMGAGSPAWNFAAGLSELAQSFLVRDSRPLFLFVDIGVSWPWKGPALIVLVGLTAVIAIATRSRLARRYLFAVLSLACMLVLSVAVAVGLVPLPGINFDYTRWFLYNFEAAIAAMFLSLVCALLFYAKNRRRLAFRAKPFPLVFAGLSLAAFVFAGSQLLPVLNKARDPESWSFELRTQDAAYWQEVLSGIDKGYPGAELITESEEFGGGFHRQKIRALDYYFSLSDTLIVNGSWIAAPWPNSRDLYGLPGPAFFENPGHPVLYIGLESSLENYLSHIPAVQSTKLRDLRDGTVLCLMVRKSGAS